MRTHAWIQAGMMLIAAVIGAQQWTKEPESFRGVKFGIPFGDAIKHGKLSSCFSMKDADPSGSTLGERICSGARIDLGSTKAITTYLDYKGKFVEVEVTCPSESYDALKALFVERYGPPTKSANEQIQNRMGAIFTDESLLWSGNKVTIALRRYAFGAVTKSSADIYLNTYATEQQAAKAAKAKRSAGAL